MQKVKRQIAKVSAPFPPSGPPPTRVSLSLGPSLLLHIEVIPCFFVSCSPQRLILPLGCSSSASASSPSSSFSLAPFVTPSPTPWGATVHTDKQTARRDERCQTTVCLLFICSRRWSCLLVVKSRCVVVVCSFSPPCVSRMKRRGFPHTGACPEPIVCPVMSSGLL